MKGWKEIPFIDFAEISPKVALKKGQLFQHIPMENIAPNLKYVTSYDAKVYNGSGTKFQNKDTLFARITPCLENGKIAQVYNIETKGAFGSTEYFVFRGKENISDADFVYYYSLTEWFRQNAINSMVGASGRQRADIGFVSKSKFKLPPLPTQKKIAGILSAYDDAIENNLRALKLLEEMAQITYEEWFVRLRFPGHASTPTNPETGLPEGWEKVKLREVLKLNYGKALKADTRIQGSIPVYGSSGIVGMHNCALVDGVGIIVGRKGNVGSVFWSHDSFYPIDTVYFVTSLHELHFLYYALRNSKFDNSDAAVPGLNRDAAYAVEITLPPKNIEKHFADLVEQNFLTIQLFEEQNQRLREARDILLPRLMTGVIDAEKYQPENFLKKN